MSLVFMFPGQSSRYPGMLDKLIALDAENANVVAAASACLGRDLQRLYALDAADPFARNRDVQVGVFLANYLFERSLARRGISARYSLGLSLGEYNHLVHIGSLEFEEALRLVDARGEAYDRGPRGWMASVQPVELEQLEDLLKDHLGSPGPAGTLEIVNRNSTRQQVIAGDQVAVERAIAHLEDEHYLQPVLIEQHVPMHSSLFEPVAREFAGYLERARFEIPRLPYISNRSAELIRDPTRETLVRNLKEHVYSPVHWQRSVEVIADAIPDAIFVEVGPMAVLHNLLHRRWLKNEKFKCDSQKDFELHFESVAIELRERMHRTISRNAQSSAEMEVPCSMT